MTIDEYYNQRDAITAMLTQALQGLIRQCAMDNNTIEVGDIISDGTSRIKVEYITPYLSLENITEVIHHD